MRYGYELAVYGGAVVFSVTAHAGLITGLSSAARGQERERPRVVEMTMITPPPVEVPPVAPVEAEEPKPKPPPPKKKKKLEDVPPPDTPPPSNTETPPEPAESAPPVFGVTMSSTVAGGSGMKVRVGNTLMKEPEEKASAPEDVKPYSGPPKKNYVPPSQVSKMAKLRGDCDGTYTPEAKRLGIEGRVKLLITIEADGTVSSARLLKGLGYGLDASAQRDIKKCSFEPAYKDGEAVAIKVPYTFTFELDEF